MLRPPNLSLSTIILLKKLKKARKILIPGFIAKGVYLKLLIIE